MSLQVNIMSELGSDEAVTKVHLGLDKDTKYRVCAGVLGQLWKASTDGDMSPLPEDRHIELAKRLVRPLISNAVVIHRLLSKFPLSFRDCSFQLLQ